MDLPDLAILRHGETEWNRAGRLQGRFDSPLTETGLAQARQQGAILTRLGVAGWDWVASPQGRALRTAEIARGGPVPTDPRLAEIGMGEWAGRLRDDLMAEHPGLFETDGLGWYDHAPGGEGLIALETRCRDFLVSLDAPSVIVTHGITSRVLRCVVQGLPAEAFDTLEGGQGVVYVLSNGQSTRHS